MNNIPSILFFDSGMGGLSVYREVRKVLPHTHYLYCFDNAFFPYSEKDESVLIERVVKICQKIDQQYPLDMIVIACNTASTVVLPRLREIFSIPVVGTVPAIKPAAQLSVSKHIGLLATKGTINRHYTDQLIEEFALNCRVERLGSTALVKIAEQKLYGSAVDFTEISHELAQWKNLEDLDTLILGCTHFPLIQQEIQQCLPQVKHFLDPAPAIARRVQSLLKDIQSRARGQKQNQMFCTKKHEVSKEFEKMMKSFGFEKLNRLFLQ